MSKTAILSKSEKTGLWEAVYAGNLLSSSTNKSYVKIHIEAGRNKKANLLGVTVVNEIGSETILQKDEVPELISFDINERFKFLEDFTDMVSKRQMRSLIITGKGGVGKSFTVMKTLDKNKMVKYVPDADTGEDASPVVSSETQEKQFVVIKGYSTPKGLFRSLYENRNRAIIFDDCDSILTNDTSANILKAALDSYSERIITWNSESFGSESDLPKSFEFTGSIVFISNLSMSKIPQAIISRAATADVSMTRDEVVQRMRMIVDSGEFMEEASMEAKTDALNFIEEHIDNQQIKGINLRTLISVVTNRTHKPGNWKRLSLSMMISSI